MINIIVAIDDNFLIGKNGKIPWNIPEDLNLFKEKTTNNIVIMGRKTFESIGKILPNRINIIISHSLKSDISLKNNNLNFESLLNKKIVFSSLEEGIKFSKNFLENNDLKKDIFIIGGASIYQETISKKLFNKLCISRIKNSYTGDTFFPKINFNNHHKIFEKEYEDFIYEEYI